MLGKAPKEYGVDKWSSTVYVSDPLDQPWGFVKEECVKLQSPSALHFIHLWVVRSESTAYKDGQSERRTNETICLLISDFRCH